MNKQIKEVKLYATFSCPYCKMEKNWLNENKVPHKVIMVDINSYEAQKMVEKTGQMGVPVTEIIYKSNDSEFIIGFEKSKLSEALQID